MALPTWGELEAQIKPLREGLQAAEQLTIYSQQSDAFLRDGQMNVQRSNQYLKTLEVLRAKVAVLEDPAVQSFAASVFKGVDFSIEIPVVLASTDKRLAAFDEFLTESGLKERALSAAEVTELQAKIAAKEAETIRAG